jgi:2-polyprenyl-6-methoxyphenol hydroxylase-like FAD-dependent oxidoreductase
MRGLSSRFGYEVSCRFAVLSVGYGMASMSVIIIGGGIGGLSLALALEQRGLSCRVYETVPEIKPLGVGISLLPHAMREFSALGLEAPLREAAIEIREHKFFNRYGQFIYSEPRGNHAGYPYPDLGIHRGRLHMVLLKAVMDRIGAGTILTNHRCQGVDQDDGGVTVSFAESSTGRPLAPVRGEIAIACDGINSVIRKQFYPEEKLAYAGINMWRGVTRHKPIFDGHTYLRVGSIDTGKMVIYPIIDNLDEQGNQLINWVAELRQPSMGMNDWNKAGKLEDFFHAYKDWHFDWLDVARLITGADQILEYPMVDRDPVAQWTFGRISLLGDAAHPMYPRGANGAAQAIIDARTLADLLAQMNNPVEALAAYQNTRLQPTAKIVRTNREYPPDYINIKVDELTGGLPFKNIDDVISREELKRISENYARIAGFSQDAVRTT